MTKEESTNVNLITSGAGIFLLCLIMRWTCINYFKLFFFTLEYRSEIWVYSNNDQGKVNQNCKFTTPHQGFLWFAVTICYKVKIHNFFKIVCYTQRDMSDDWICSNDNQVRVWKYWKFHDPQGKGCCAREWTY